MSFIRIVGPQVAVQADDVFLSYLSGVWVFFISNIDSLASIDTCFIRQFLQLADCCNIRISSTVGDIGKSAQRSRSSRFLRLRIGCRNSTTYGYISRLICQVYFSC